MHEQIPTAVVGCDKAVTLLCVEPFDCTGCHRPLPCPSRYTIRGCPPDAITPIPIPRLLPAVLRVTIGAERRILPPPIDLSEKLGLPRHECREVDKPVTRPDFLGLRRRRGSEGRLPSARAQGARSGH